MKNIKIIQIIEYILFSLVGICLIIIMCITPPIIVYDSKND